jgi:hypothetical protein
MAFAADHHQDRELGSPYLGMRGCVGRTEDNRRKPSSPSASRPAVQARDQVGDLREIIGSGLRPDDP